jgi:hypothetical protein
MKRDMDLIREIALWFERQPEKAVSWDNSEIRRTETGNPIEGQIPDIKDFSNDEILYAIELMVDAKLIEVERHSDHSGKFIRPIRLTWEGHEFLDAARDDTRWNKAKDIVKEKGGSLTFDVIKAVLVQLARQAVGLP